MILSDANQRLILWGASLEGGKISAELIFCEQYLNSGALEIRDSRTNTIYIVKLPAELRDLDFATISTNIRFALDTL